MSDSEFSPDEVRDAVESWARAPEKAKAEALEEASRIGWRIYAITVLAAALIAALLSSALTYTFLTAWSSDWRIEHATGLSEQCARDYGGLFAMPRYTCVEHP